MTPLTPRPTWPEIQVVSTVPAEPHMHIQFGMDTPVPVLGYAVWSDGQMTPMFHWPQHGQIRAVSPRETGWALRVIPPKNDPQTVDAPQDGVARVVDHDRA